MKVAEDQSCVHFVEPVSVQMLAGGMFVATVGFMFSDVATDAIMVERSKREGSQNQGHMQAIAYSVRFVGR